MPLDGSFFCCSLFLLFLKWFEVRPCVVLILLQGLDQLQIRRGKKIQGFESMVYLMDIIRMEEWSSVLLAASLDFLSQNTISTAIQHFAQDGSSKKIGLPLHTRLAAFTSKLPVKSGGISEFLPWWLWRDSTTPSCEVLDHQCSWLLLWISSCIHNAAIQHFTWDGSSQNIGLHTSHKIGCLYLKASCEICRLLWISSLMIVKTFSSTPTSLILCWIWHNLICI